jgi:hypothetical protein
VPYCVIVDAAPSLSARSRLLVPYFYSAGTRTVGLQAGKRGHAPSSRPFMRSLLGTRRLADDRILHKMAYTFVPDYRVTQGGTGSAIFVSGVPVHPLRYCVI